VQIGPRSRKRDLRFAGQPDTRFATGSYTCLPGFSATGTPSPIRRKKGLTLLSYLFYK